MKEKKKTAQKRTSLIAIFVPILYTQVYNGLLVGFMEVAFDFCILDCGIPKFNYKPP